MTDAVTEHPAEHPAALAAREVVATLVAQGVRDVVLAPGSRSAPLAYALAAAADAGWLQVHVRVDERVAGFVALGIARVRPAAVVVTSGTAVANLHPAVLEAHHSHLPLVVLSADRPHELRGVGASQTTDQAGLFGGAVRLALDVPAADGEPRGVTSALVRAVAAATGVRSGDPGPVQVNIGFRDPLVPAAPWRPGGRPGSRPVRGLEVVLGAAAGGTVRVDGTSRGVVVAGDGAGRDAVDLAAALGWPLLAEPTSGARRSPHAVAAYRRVLADPDGPAAEIEQVVVLGRPTLSRDVSALLGRTDLAVLVVGPHPGWTDVAGTAAVVAGDALPEGSTDPSWLSAWQQAGDTARTQMLPDDARGDPLTGQDVAAALLAPDQPHAVVLGSSLAVRHADLAAGVGEGFTRAPVLSNRGLAGIDGTISTATGLALATGEPVRVLVGDLTFLHDVGGLAHGVHEPEVDLQVVVLDDAGGGIFATLEHGRPEHAAVHPRFFGTPQRLDVAALTAGFGATALTARTRDDLAAVLAAPVTGRSVVHVPLV